MLPHRLFAAGISAALLVGAAAAPVLADPAVGRVRGQGRTANAAHFSVEVRQEKLARGEFHYRSADGRFKVRCKGFDSYSPRAYIVPGAPAATVQSDDCVLERPRKKRTRIAVEAEFVDHSSFTRGAKDEVNLTFTLPGGTKSDTGRILSGNVTVR